MADLLKRLRDLRDDKDKTQGDIGEILGMQKAGYQKIEKGDRKLDSRDLIKLCMYYDVTADYILGLSNNPKKGRFG